MLTFLLACITQDPASQKEKTDSTTDSPADSQGDSSQDSQEESGQNVDTPSFGLDVVPVMNDKCAGCHYSQPEGLPLYNEEAYDLLVNVPSGQLPSMDRVEPGDLENSYLWRKLEDTHKAAGGKGEKMPGTYGEPLTSQELELFRAWIVGGALR